MIEARIKAAVSYRHQGEPIVTVPVHALIRRAAEAFDVVELWHRLQALDDRPLTDEECAIMRTRAESTRAELERLEAEARQLDDMIARRAVDLGLTADEAPASSMWVLALRGAGRVGQHPAGRVGMALVRARAALAGQMQRLASEQSAWRSRAAGAAAAGVLPRSTGRVDLAPLVRTLVDEHGWTAADVTALVTGPEVWKSHPCPTARALWSP